MELKTDQERVDHAAAKASDSARFKRAIETFDRLNDEDPKRVDFEGRELGYERYFSELLFAQTLSLNPDASEPLLLAARSQHLRRWSIPRSDYPMDRAGYLKWRSDLKRFHAEKAGEALSDLGYDDGILDAVGKIHLKQDLKGNPDSQTMEDALCLVFLQYQFADFRAKASEEKLVSILQKTWAKMSDAGRQAALQLNLGEEEKRLVALALSEG